MNSVPDPLTLLKIVKELRRVCHACHTPTQPLKLDTKNHRILPPTQKGKSGIPLVILGGAVV